MPSRRAEASATVSRVSRITGQGDSKPAAAQRLRRPSWRDPRLIFGVLIMVLSVAGVILLLAAQDRTVAVYAADRPLSTGDQLTAEDLRSVSVHLSGAAEQYLSADEEVPEGLQLTRRVGQGELVPAAALADADPAGRQAVTVQAQHDLARAVQPGRMVDVWASAGSAVGEEAAEAAQLVTAAEVTDVREASSAFGAQNAVTVELLVSAEELAELLTAVGEGSAVSVLPAADPVDAR